MRDYGVAAHILRDLGVTSVALLTNNPAKHASLRAHGIKVTERLPLLPPAHGGGGGDAGTTSYASVGSMDSGSSGKGKDVGRSSRNGSQPHFV